MWQAWIWLWLKKYVAGSWKWWAQERTEWDARERHTRDRSCFAPITSKRLLRRLWLWLNKSVKLHLPLYRSFWKRPEHGSVNCGSQQTTRDPMRSQILRLRSNLRRVLFSFQSLLPIQTILCTYTPQIVLPIVLILFVCMFISFPGSFKLFGQQLAYQGK